MRAFTPSTTSAYLATEAAPSNIRVNAISPGMTKTEGWLTKTEAMGKQQGKSPEEVRAGMSQGLGIRLTAGPTPPRSVPWPPSWRPTTPPT